MYLIDLMKKKGTFVRGGVVLGVTQAAGQVISLGRNVIIARLISPADFGIASIFLLAVSFLELISNLSLDRLLVQSSDGDTEKFQLVAQYLQVIRGVACFVILIAIAGPLSTLFSIPEAKGSFRILSFIPLLNGFIHFDPRRMERKMDFWPQASIELASQIVVLLIVWPVAKWFGDYKAMLFLLIIKTLVTVAGSHFIAKRKYGWATDYQFTKRFMSFGWPLLVNGLLMFCILQGDRFVLGSAKKIFGSTYDMTDVGLYSAAFMLSMMPAMFCIRICSSLFLPVLSRAQDSTQIFNSQVRLFLQGLTVITVGYGGVMLLAGDELLPMIYGEQYRTAGLLVGCLSTLWAIRIVRVLPATISMAKGNTKNLMYANIVRLVFLTGVVLVVIQGMDLIWLASVGIIGEICTYWFSLILNKRNLGIPLSIFVPSSYLLGAGLAIATVLNIAVLRSMTGPMWFICVSVTSLALPAFTILFFAEAQQKLKSIVFNKHY